MKRQMYRLYEKIRKIRTRNVRNYLRIKKIYQEDNFNENISLFNSQLEELELKNIKKFILPIWEENNQRIRNIFLNNDFSFLRNPFIRETMFITSEGDLMRSQLTFLKNKLKEEKLKHLLEEEYVGNPIISNIKYKTSHNTIHNLFHIVLYSELIKTNISDIKNIIEWGGGYGNLARIFRKVNPNQTYIIIDLPLFSCIQWIYLSSVFGKEAINLIKKDKSMIKEGKINLLPVCFLEKFKLNADLFISTWALSESSKYSQDYVIKNNWFNAKHHLLAFQNNIDKNLDASPIIDFAKRKNIKIFSVKHLNGNSYAFD